MVFPLLSFGSVTAHLYSADPKKSLALSYYVVVDSSNTHPQLSLLHPELIQVSQPFFLHAMLQPPNHLESLPRLTSGTSMSSTGKHKAGHSTHR